MVVETETSVGTKDCLLCSSCILADQRKPIESAQSFSVFYEAHLFAQPSPEQNPFVEVLSKSQL